MTIADIRPEEDIADLLKATEKLIHGHQEPTIWRHRKKNGEIIDVEVIGHDLHWHGIEAQLVAARDVTERRRVQDAMIESEGRYRSLFENMLEGFAYCEMLFDDRGRPKDFVYLAVNSAFGKLTRIGKRSGQEIYRGDPGW
jgi:PAS domain-containing protein